MVRFFLLLALLAPALGFRRNGPRMALVSRRDQRLASQHKALENLQQALDRFSGAAPGVAAEGEDPREGVEKAIDILQSFHLPAMTLEFLNVMLMGNWTLVYSSVPVQSGIPRAENGAPLVRVFEVRQRLSEEEGKKMGGSLVNTLFWDVPSEPGVRGYLDVRCEYNVSSNGALEVQPIEHVVKPEKMPADPQTCINGLQGMSPECFDPKGRWITSYADPFLRVLSGADGRLDGIRLIFKRDAEDGAGGSA